MTTVIKPLSEEEIEIVRGAFAKSRDWSLFTFVVIVFGVILLTALAVMQAPEAWVPIVGLAIAAGLGFNAVYMFGQQKVATTAMPALLIAQSDIIKQKELLRECAAFLAEHIAACESIAETERKNEDNPRV